MRIHRSIVLVALVLVIGLPRGAMAAPVVDAAGASPTFLTVNEGTSVLFTAQIADASVIATGVNLVNSDASGRALTVAGVMKDDGTSGDVVAGDRIFSLRLTLQRSTPGHFYYRVSAPFRGVLVRSLSSLIDITVLAPPIISVSFDREPNIAGWYKGPVTAHFSCAAPGTTVTSCPPDRTIDSEGSNQTVSGSATDALGRTANVTSAPFKIDLSVPAVSISLTPGVNGNGWNNSPVTAHFVCSDSLSGIATCPPDRVISTEGADQEIVGEAVDRAGNIVIASERVSIDRTAPTIALTWPPPAWTVYSANTNVIGTISDALSGLRIASCGSAVVPIVNGSFECQVTLEQGANSLTGTVTDAAGNVGTASASVTYLRIPVVTLASPGNLSYFNITPTTVTGTVDDPTATVTVNSVVAPVVNGTFSIPLPLAEGPNIITATATTPAGATGTTSVAVTLDTTQPHVTVTSPPADFVTNQETISVAGIVNDIVVGTVNEEEARVAVNGVAAAVANRTFLAATVPLTVGPNTIRVVGTDRVGNAATAELIVTRQVPTQPHIQVVSGNNQTAAIGATVANTLVAALLDGAGQPLPNQPVIFKVTQNDGLVQIGGGEAAATIVTTTNADGRAEVRWTLGHRAGAGGNAVEAYSVGFEGTALFTATGVQGQPGKIVVDTGNDQIGAAGQALPKPFIAVVVDEGNNRLAGVHVTFTVQEGGGTIDGESSQTVISDSDGRVAARLTLGAQEGNANNLVSATFIGNAGFPVNFTASGRVAGNPAETSISGVVLDNSNLPVPGVTVRAVSTPAVRSSLAVIQSVIAVKTDAQGQFTIPQAPVGVVKLMLDGTTVERPEPYPSLEYDMVTVAGQVNTVGQPIYILPLSTANQLCVTEATGGGTLTVPEAPGFSLTFGPGQVTFPGGSKSGCVSVTVVHGDKVPMVPGFGQQPRFIVTIQPAGAVFNPPAPITLPNVDGLAPRTVTEMYSYDHDISSFVAIGTGVVSDDGLVIRSSTGVGVLKAGWHCGGDPAAAGSVADCPICKYCDGQRCVGDSSQDGRRSTTDKCMICQGGSLGRVPLDLVGTSHSAAISPPVPMIDSINKSFSNFFDKLNVGISLSLVPLTVTGTVTTKDCCDAVAGVGIEKTLSGTGNFGGLNFAAKVYPLLAPPLSIPADTYPLGFATINVGAVSVDAGVFVKLNVGVTGTLGFRQKTCSVLAEDQAGCFYGNLSNQIVASIAAEAKVNASVTLDCGGASWCTGKFALSGALVGGDASLPLSISQVKYNSTSCTEGLSGGLVQLGSFKFKNGINLSFAYTDSGGGKVTYSYAKDFVACSFQTPGGFTCDWQY